MTNGTLTRAALVVRVADAAGLTKKRAEIIVGSLFGSIAEALRQGEKVELRGFGSFQLRCRGPHSARNPRTGARVDVPSKRVAYFPIFHEAPPPLEQVRPCVRRLDLVADDVGERRLDDSRGWSVSSAAQSRNVDRKPWTTAGMLQSLRIPAHDPEPGAPRAAET